MESGAVGGSATSAWEGRCFAALAWAVALAAFFLPVANPDLFWHLSAAKYMVAHGAVPRSDWLSFTMRGRPWVDFEWLCELFWYAALHFGGWTGLVAFKAAVFALAAACLWRFLSLYGLSAQVKAVALLDWSLALIPLGDLRPENFSLLFFTLELWFLEARRLKRSGPFPAWALVALYALWANLHAGFAFGLALLSVYSATELWRGKGAALAVWTAACLAATLINPYGGRLHQVLVEHARDLETMRSHIAEWEPLRPLDWLLAPFCAAMLAAGVSMGLRWARDRRLPAEHVLALGLFSLLAARYERFMLYAELAAVPVAACHGDSISRALPRRWRTPAIAASAAMLVLFFLVRYGPVLRHWRPFIPRYVPQRTLGFLEENRGTLKGHRMLNPWEWGGYLGYELWPDLEVFFDGRYLFHPLLEPSDEARNSPSDFRYFLDGFGVDTVLLRGQRLLRYGLIRSPSGKSARLPRPYYLEYLPEADWAMVSWNREGCVFVRRSAFAKDWIKANEYALFRPNDYPAATFLVQNGVYPWDKLRAEYERYLRWTPEAAQDARLAAWISSLKPVSSPARRRKSVDRRERMPTLAPRE